MVLHAFDHVGDQLHASFTTQLSPEWETTLSSALYILNIIISLKYFDNSSFNWSIMWGFRKRNARKEVLRSFIVGSSSTTFTGLKNL